MRYKYVPPAKKLIHDGNKGRHVRPEKWITGPDPLRREKYYAYLKHKSQALYRKQSYELSWEDWETLWPDDLFLQRGRSVDNLCMSRIDFHDSWRIDNVEITTRGEHLKRNGEYRSG